MKKKLIVYCDDQQRFREKFRQDHGQHYDIITTPDTNELLNALERLEHLPDLILLDLYYPRNLGEDYETRRQQAEQSLSKLDAQIAETNKAVLNAWEPRGIDVLEFIREKYPDETLPIAIYTQKGLILLDDVQLRKVEQLDGGWLLKKKLHPKTEALRIDRMILNANKLSAIKTEVPRIFRVLLGLSWLISGLFIARLFFNTSELTDIIASVIVALVVALISYLLSPWIGSLDG